MPYVPYANQRATDHSVLLHLTVNEARMLAILIDKFTEFELLTDENTLNAMGDILTRLRSVTPKKKKKKE